MRIIAALLWSTLLLSASSALAAKQPNVFLIISDDQAWTDFGFMGHAAIETPNLANAHFPLRSIEFNPHRMTR